MSETTHPEGAPLEEHIERVRLGYGANCSSVGSVVDTLFATAAVGAAVFAAIVAALKAGSRTTRSVLCASASSAAKRPVRSPRSPRQGTSRRAASRRRQSCEGPGSRPVTGTIPTRALARLGQGPPARHRDRDRPARATNRLLSMSNPPARARARARRRSDRARRRESRAPHRAAPGRSPRRG